MNYIIPKAEGAVQALSEDDVGLLVETETRTDETEDDYLTHDESTHDTSSEDSRQLNDIDVDDLTVSCDNAYTSGSAAGKSSSSCSCTSLRIFFCK